MFLIRLQLLLGAYFMWLKYCLLHRRLLRGERLIIMAGTAQMEWHQTPGNHVFDVYDTIPLIPLQSLPRAFSPINVPPTSCGLMA
jgi:hypothetical protein